MPISMKSASALSCASSVGTVYASVCLAKNMPQYALWNIPLVVLGCGIIPAIALKYTPAVRLWFAKAILRDIKNKEIVEQDSLNKLEFYRFIDTHYADLSWPLMGAKDELKKYYSALDGACKQLKKATTEVRNRGQQWPEGIRFSIEIERFKTHVTELLKLINEHPDYQKLVCEYENKKSFDNLIAATRYQARANMHYNLN